MTVVEPMLLEKTANLSGSPYTWRSSGKVGRVVNPKGSIYTWRSGTKRLPVTIEQDGRFRASSLRAEAAGNDIADGLPGAR